MQTADFKKRLKSIKTDSLKDFLESRTEPCYEAALLRIAFPETDIAAADSLRLYQNHFLLFNRLYDLQDGYYAEGKYLYIHFMRTFLFNYPQEGQCRFFEESLMKFCDAPCDPGESVCPFHLERMEQAALDRLSERYFYRDPENFYRLNAETAEKFMNGTWELLRRHDEVKQGFKVLDLPETAGPDMIRRRFRLLAKECHPDTGECNSEEFIRINNAYRLLMRLVPLF